MHDLALKLNVDLSLPCTVSPVGEVHLDTRAVLDRFLADVERRAYKIARITVRDHDDALDIVQDAMLQLVRHYATAPEDQWPLLFFRILRNRIVDHQRRGGVRRRVLAWFSGTGDGEDDEEDALARLPGPPDGIPERQVAMGNAMEALEAALAALPPRQQEVFLLRALEGLDTAQTASVMGCSQGSVKTHYSRAVHSLRATLGEHWP